MSSPVEKLTLSTVLRECTDKDMLYEKNRLASFTSWPFVGDCKCTKENMARAGFYHCPTEEDPDLTRCYVCFKEMTGWEAQDDPVQEHARSGHCLLLQMGKTEAELTLRDVFTLEAERNANRVEKTLGILKTRVWEGCNAAKQELNKLKRAQRRA